MLLGRVLSGSVSFHRRPERCRCQPRFPLGPREVQYIPRVTQQVRIRAGQDRQSGHRSWTTDSVGFCCANERSLSTGCHVLARSADPFWQDRSHPRAADEDRGPQRSRDTCPGPRGEPAGARTWTWLCGSKPTPVSTGPPTSLHGPKDSSALSSLAFTAAPPHACAVSWGGKGILARSTGRLAGLGDDRRGWQPLATWSPRWLAE